MARAIALGWLVLTLALAGCGGGAGSDGEPPAAPTVAAGQAAEQTLGRAGGRVVLSTREGATFTLELPAGALDGDTRVRLETDAATPTQRFQLRLLPAGLVLAGDAPATLRIALPAGLALPAGAALGYDGMPIAYTTTADGQLQVQLARLAGEAAVAQGLARAAAARPRMLQSAVGAACGGLVLVADFATGVLVAADAAAVQAYGRCMLAAVQALAASGQHVDAVKLASATAAYLQSIGSDDPAGFVEQASAIACAAYRDALDRARADRVQSMGQLATLVRPILFWETATQQLGADCRQVAIGEYQTVVDAKAAEAAEAYAQRKAELASVDSPAYAEAVGEARAQQATVRELQSLQPPAAVATAARTAIVQTAQPALLDAMLQAPWQRCRDSGAYDRLIELAQLMDDPAPVRAAAQYCGTRLQVQATDRQGGLTGTLQPALGGSAAGVQRIAGELAVRSDGRLRLSGPIRALQCPAGQGDGSEALELRVNDRPVQTLADVDGYLAGTLELDMATLLQTAGIAAQDFRSATLTVARTGQPCGGFWGEAPQPLLALTLTGGVCVPAAGEPFCATPIEFASAPDLVTLLAHTRAGVLLRTARAGVNCEDGSAACGLVWRAGRLRTLPAAFEPAGMADDGTVVGEEYGALDPYSARALTHVALVLPGATAPTRLADDEPYDAALQRRHTFDAPVISPAGRITYREYEEQTVTPPTDLGYCQPVGAPGGTTRNFCVRHRWYGKASPGAAATVVHTEGLPSLLDQKLFGDIAPLGRFGYSAADEVARIEFAAIADGGAGTRVLAVDEDGRRLVETNAGGMRTSAVLPAPDALPAGWVPQALGRAGHVLLLTPDRTQARLLDLRTQTLGPAMPSQPTVTVDGVAVQVDLRPNGIQHARLFDPLGRMAVPAASAGRPNLRAAVLTPPGVALP